VIVFDGVALHWACPSVEVQTVPPVVHVPGVLPVKAALADAVFCVVVVAASYSTLQFAVAPPARDGATIAQVFPVASEGQAVVDTLASGLPALNATFVAPAGIVSTTIAFDNVPEPVFLTVPLKI
jgi:hypothetical protein